MKNRMIQEHYSKLGQQAAEQAMQRRQQLLAQQQRWLEGGQVLPPASKKQPRKCCFITFFVSALSVHQPKSRRMHRTAVTAVQYHRTANCSSWTANCSSWTYYCICWVSRYCCKDNTATKQSSGPRVRVVRFGALQAMVDGDALVFDDTGQLSDTSGLVRDLYTLPEECTADFSDISKVLGDGRSQGFNQKSPRGYVRSLSRGSSRLRSPHAAASPGGVGRGSPTFFPVASASGTTSLVLSACYWQHFFLGF